MRAFRISLCLTYFSFLAIQLSICGFPAAAGAFSGEKASCLARQLTYISTDKRIRQAFFEIFSDFFRNYFRKFFPCAGRPFSIPYIVCATQSICKPICNSRNFPRGNKKSRADPRDPSVFYLQPPHVLQLPVHFLTGLPVAENISPDHSRAAAAPHAGQTTGSSNFFTSSSNFLPHAGQTYCNTGIGFAAF